jgi:hypothetical protein
MTDRQFLETIHGVAEELKGEPLSLKEKNIIIETFNIKLGSPYEKAKSTIEEVVGKKFADELILEKAASLNSLQNLLNQLNSAANDWLQGKK